MMHLVCFLFRIFLNPPTNFLACPHLQKAGLDTKQCRANRINSRQKAATMEFVGFRAQKKTQRLVVVVVVVAVAAAVECSSSSSSSRSRSRCCSSRTSMHPHPPTNLSDRKGYMLQYVAGGQIFVVAVAVGGGNIKLQPAVRGALTKDSEATIAKAASL